MLSHAASAALFLSRVGLTRSRVVQTAEERITRTTMPPGRLERLEVRGTVGGTVPQSLCHSRLQRVFVCDFQTTCTRTITGYLYLPRPVGGTTNVWNCLSPSRLPASPTYIQVLVMIAAEAPVVAGTGCIFAKASHLPALAHAK